MRSLYHGERREGPKREPPPPLQLNASPRACVVLASCLRHACYEGKTTRAPPPSTHLQPRRVEDEGRGGRKAPPPPRTKRQVGEAPERGDGPHDRARREHALCKPQRGNDRGCERRVGRATRGATRQAFPPAEGQVPRSCLRRACNVLTPDDRQRGHPPPDPLLPTPPRKGVRTARRRRGDMGGGQMTDRTVSPPRFPHFVIFRFRPGTCLLQ